MAIFTTKWFITAIVLVVLFMIIEFLQFYYKIYKKLPFFDRKIKEQKPPPTIRKPIVSGDLENDKNQNDKH